MTAFVIESNIPVPPVKRPGMQRGPLRATLGALKVGQSVNCEDITKHFANNICWIAGRDGDGKKFTYRKTESGYRIWRTK